MHIKINDKYYKGHETDLMLKPYVKELISRPSCYACPFKGDEHCSDFTIFDCWSIGDYSKDMDDDKGTSLIFINNQTGQALFEEIKTGMLYQEVSINEAVKYNSAAIKSSTPNSNRDNFFRDVGSLSFDILVKKYCTDKISIRLKRKFRSTLKKIATKLGLVNVIKKFIR